MNLQLSTVAGFSFRVSGFGVQVANKDSQLRVCGWSQQVSCTTDCNTVWSLVGNGGMGYWAYYKGPLRDYHRDPFTHSLLSTRQYIASRWPPIYTGASEIRGTLVWDPYNKDPTLLFGVLY